MDLLDRMTTFVRVVDARSFSAAAKQLRRSVPAVSRQIATLERDLRVQLVRRTTRRMTVTDRGRVFYEHCQRVLREVELAHAVGTSGLVGPLRVSAPISYGLAFIAPRIAAFTASHPEIALDLQLEDRPVDLVLEDFDIAVRVGMPAPQSTDVVAHAIGAHRRIVVAAPAYLARRGVPSVLDELSEHDALVHNSDRGRWTFENGARRAEVPIRTTFRSNALLLVHQLACDGLGLAYLPDWFVAPDIASGRLRHLVRSWRSPSVSAYALHRRALRGEARVRAFLRHLTEVEA